MGGEGAQHSSLLGTDTSTAPIPAVSHLWLEVGMGSAKLEAVRRFSRLPLSQYMHVPRPPLPAERLSPGQVEVEASDLPGKLSPTSASRCGISTLALGLPCCQPTTCLEPGGPITGSAA